MTLGRWAGKTSSGVVVLLAGGGPCEADGGRGNTVTRRIPKSCSPRGPKTHPLRAPKLPQSYPKVVQQLQKSCPGCRDLCNPTSAISGHVWVRSCPVSPPPSPPQFGQHRPLSEFGLTQIAAIFSGACGEQLSGQLYPLCHHRPLQGHSHDKFWRLRRRRAVGSSIVPALGKLYSGSGLWVGQISPKSEKGGRPEFKPEPASQDSESDESVPKAPCDAHIHSYAIKECRMHRLSSNSERWETHPGRTPSGLQAHFSGLPPGDPS